jgi:hypothetical protein
LLFSCVSLSRLSLAEVVMFCATLCYCTFVV